VKIAIACKSLLLQKSLEIFLKEYLSSYRYADFLISDRKIDINKPLFLISNKKEANLKVPFSKSQLLLEIKYFYKKNIKPKKPLKEDKIKILEKKIEILCETFKKEIIKSIKEQYGNYEK